MEISWVLGIFWGGPKPNQNRNVAEQNQPKSNRFAIRNCEAVEEWNVPRFFLDKNKTKWMTPLKTNMTLENAHVQ